MLVMKADLNEQMSRNLAAFCDIDVTGFPRATLKIILPGDHHRMTQKYNMPDQFGDNFRSEDIVKFTRLYFDRKLLAQTDQKEHQETNNDDIIVLNQEEFVKF